jgi:hypothetical protein
MKFATTEKTPVRYEAQPETWVEHAQPNTLGPGQEVAVFKCEPLGDRPRIWASIHVHNDKGNFAVELIVNGWGDSEYERRLFEQTREFEPLRAALLDRLRELGVGCGNCGGRGWVPHDDVPAAVCGACDGFGYSDPQRPRHVYTDGVIVGCDACRATGSKGDAASFIALHRGCK